MVNTGIATLQYNIQVWTLLGIYKSDDILDIQQLLVFSKKNTSFCKYISLINEIVMKFYCMKINRS